MITIQDEIKRLDDNYKLQQLLIKLSNEYIKTIIENNNKIRIIKNELQ